MVQLDKKEEILDCAQTLLQQRGFDGFSYADISSVVGIRKASIHHYFPTKIDLVVAVIERYRENFNASLLQIDSCKKELDKIKQYIKLYKDVLDEDKLCLCGVLASTVGALPERVNKAIREFLFDNIAWLTRVLMNHSRQISKRRAANFSWQIVNQLQGGIAMARIVQDPNVFSVSCDELLQQLKVL